MFAQMAFTWMGGDSLKGRWFGGGLEGEESTEGKERRVSGGKQGPEREG